jgi:hypothetical protein
MLRKKAAKQLDEELGAAVDAFVSALNAMHRKGYAEYREVRSMALNLLLKESFTRTNFGAWMDSEKETGKVRTKAIDSIHRHLAQEFLKKLDKVGEDVEELRNEVDYHSHG